MVRELVDARRGEGVPGAEEEQEELQRLGEEAREWVRLSGLLLEEVAGRGEEGKEEEEEEEESRSPPGKEVGAALVCLPLFVSCNF